MQDIACLSQDKKQTTESYFTNNMNELEMSLLNKGFIQQPDGSWSKPERKHASKNNDNNQRMDSEVAKPVEVFTLDDEAKVQDGSLAEASKRPTVIITMHRVRCLDRDNKWSAVKELLDGVTRSKLVIGDSEDDIDLEVRQVKCKKAEIKTTIEIIYT